MATIQFIVEDGTGYNNSTSYAAVADYRQYWINRGIDKTAEDDLDIQGRLNIATEWIDQTFNWIGERSHWGYYQALCWPRYGVEYPIRGTWLDPKQIPLKLIQAVCYLAAQVVNGEMAPAGVAIKEENYGSNRRMYLGSDRSIEFPQLQTLLKGLCTSGLPISRQA